MYSEEARAFLSRPLTARLATFGRDGYPHAVPLWFMLDGDDVVIISERKTGKVANLLANPRAAVTVGGDPGTGAGYLLRGDVTISDDTDHVWTNRMTYHYEEREAAEKYIEEWKDLDMVVIRMAVARVTKVYEG